MNDLKETLKELSKYRRSIDKLIDNVSRAIGILYEPIHVKREAKAEAEAKIIKTEADIEINELIVRAESRLEYQRLRRQINIESILKKSASVMKEIEDDSPVNEDWVVRFFDYAQDIGDEEMQSLWANILAQQVSNPNSFSLRTLEFVKTLNSYEANSFTKLCSFLWIENNSVFFLSESDARECMKTKGFDRNDLNILREIGLVKHENYHYQIEEGVSKSIYYFGREYLIRRSIDSGVSGVDILYLTKIGSELAPISGAIPDDDYMHAMQKMLTRFKWHLEDI